MLGGGETITRKLTDADRLRILHVMRAPVGGLFRHVVDLSREQAKAGHEVGIIADSLTGDARANEIFEELAPALSLGVRRMPMQRLPHPADLVVAWRIADLIRELAPDVAHGHGAKGGVFVRLPALLPGYPAPKRELARVYTPHGGSLHYSKATIGGRLFFMAERAMERVTDLIPFESEFARRRFTEDVCVPRALSPVVHNGLAAAEFIPVVAAPGASDFVFIGEFRACKGVDTLLSAFASLDGDYRLTLVGSGPDERALRACAEELGVASRITFHPAIAGREALRFGRILVAPSRAESLPYIVLEAIAAGLPVIATDIGGLPEIFGPWADRLLPPEDVEGLARAMRRMADSKPDALATLTSEMTDYVRARFTLERMTDGILRGYRKALSAERAAAIASGRKFQTEIE